ncbi:MAG TPA: DinB family protein, partial [Anaerolineales bacterium]|nr:DinB family protein [Anaerolineales bacterium]
MNGNILAMLFEHNNWANDQIIKACLSLSDEHLDAEPQSATMGSIRKTLLHLANGQQGYLRLLTVPLEERLDPVTDPPFADIKEAVKASGEGLLALARDASALEQMGRIQTRDRWLI